MKPAREDGSIGIEFSAVVNSIRELMERMDWLHAHFDSPVLIEEYIEGREMYVGIIGNDNAAALPIVELDLSKLPDGTPRIAAAEVKWGKGTKAYRDTKSAIATDLAEETIRTLVRTLDKQDIEEATVRAEQPVAKARCCMSRVDARASICGTQKSLQWPCQELNAMLVFNLADSFADDDSADFKIAAFLELRGENEAARRHREPTRLMLAQDKAVAKKSLRD